MFDRAIFVLVLIGAVGVLIAGFLLIRAPVGGKLMNTASALLGVGSLLQLRVSGWFERVIQDYSDVEQYPYGPPSAIVRQIIDDPDHPFQTYLRNTLFFNPETGANLAIASLMVAIAATWS